MERRGRELALFNVGLDSKLRACDLGGLMERDRGNCCGPVDRVVRGDFRLVVDFRAATLQWTVSIRCCLSKLLEAGGQTRLGPAGHAARKLPLAVTGLGHMRPLTVASFLHRSGTHRRGLASLRLNMSWCHVGLPHVKLPPKPSGEDCEPCWMDGGSAAAVPSRQTPEPRSLDVSGDHYDCGSRSKDDITVHFRHRDLAASHARLGNRPWARGGPGCRGSAWPASRITWRQAGGGHRFVNHRVRIAGRERRHQPDDDARAI